jgi:hypothetical protein
MNSVHRRPGLELELEFLRPTLTPPALDSFLSSTGIGRNVRNRVVDGVHWQRIGAGIVNVKGGQES